MLTKVLAYNEVVSDHCYQANKTLSFYIMFFLVPLIDSLGYYALFLGAIMEGESVVWTMSSLAYIGKFNIAYVLLITFTGTFGSDQILFYVGRLLGGSVFKKFPKIEKKSASIFDILKRNETAFILGFRFIYGVRTISPLIAGIAKINARKFNILNFLAALIWTFLNCGIGYGIGMFSAYLGMTDLKYTIGFVFLFNIIMLIIIHFLSKRFSRKIIDDNIE